MVASEQWPESGDMVAMLVGDEDAAEIFHPAWRLRLHTGHQSFQTDAAVDEKSAFVTRKVIAVSLAAAGQTHKLHRSSSFISIILYVGSVLKGCGAGYVLSGKYQEFPTLQLIIIRECPPPHKSQRASPRDICRRVAAKKFFAAGVRRALFVL